MKIICNCPTCDSCQSRWQALEPAPGFPNKCEDCGSHYRIGWLGNAIGVLIGLLLVAIINLGMEKYVSWYMVLIGVILVVGFFSFSAPYWIKLSSVECSDSEANYKRMNSFIIIQLLIVVVLVFNIYVDYIFSTLVYSTTDKICCIEEFENLTSVEKLRELSVLLASEVSQIIDITAEAAQLKAKLGIMLSSVLLCLCSLNFLFCYKFKSVNQVSNQSDENTKGGS